MDVKKLFETLYALKFFIIGIFCIIVPVVLTPFYNSFVLLYILAVISVVLGAFLIVSSVRF